MIARSSQEGIVVNLPSLWAPVAAADQDAADGAGNAEAGAGDAEAGAGAGGECA